MMRRTVYRVGLIVWCVCAFGLRNASAQTASPGPYYATPSWDQTLACTTLATCPRFVVLSNFNSQAVLDRETGLVWERSPATGTASFGIAAFRCTRATIGNRKGWRLPTIQELNSLMDPAVLDLPIGHPFNMVPGQYWSSTDASSIIDGTAWAMLFGSDDSRVEPKASLKLLWCVRGGVGVAIQ